MRDYKENVWAALVEVWKSVDRLGAALVGWSGKYMISTELVRRHCVLCKLVRKALDGLWPEHCIRSARKEGLL